MAITTTITFHAEPKAEPQWWSAAAAAVATQAEAEAEAETETEVATKEATVLYVLYGADDDMCGDVRRQSAAHCAKILAICCKRSFQIV